MRGPCKGLGILARAFEPHRLVKGGLRLQQSRIRLLPAGPRSCRTAEDHHHHPPDDLPHLYPSDSLFIIGVVYGYGASAYSLLRQRPSGRRRWYAGALTRVLFVLKIGHHVA
jgi:hypothetical protein